MQASRQTAAAADLGMTTAMPLLLWLMTPSAVSVSLYLVLTDARQPSPSVAAHTRSRAVHYQLASHLLSVGPLLCCCAISIQSPGSNSCRHAASTTLHQRSGTGMATPPPVATGSPTAEAGHPPTPPANQLEAAAMRAVASESQQEAAPPTFVLLATQHYLRLYTPEGIRQGAPIASSAASLRRAVLASMLLSQKVALLNRNLRLCDTVLYLAWQDGVNTQYLYHCSPKHVLGKCVPTKWVIYRPHKSAAQNAVQVTAPRCGGRSWRSPSCTRRRFPRPTGRASPASPTPATCWSTRCLGWSRSWCFVVCRL